MDVNQATREVERRLEDLKQFTSTHGNGCTRLPFSKETRDAAEYLKEEMRQAGLEVREDTVGNVIGVLPGRDRTKPAIVNGSHYDSVYNGGNYDGIAGVIVAIEIAAQLNAAGIQLERDYVVVAFMDEEGCRFGTGYFGSKSILGQMTVEECKHFTDKDGISVYSAMRDYGLVPEKIPEAAWAPDRIGYYVEAHIEQGPVLDAKGLEIGLVNGIVGIQRYMFNVHGRSDHAGTTPMDMRKDSVDAATKVISKIADFAREAGKGTVATVGYVNAVPGGMNVVAQSMEFSVDIRSMDNDIINDIADKIRACLKEETEKIGGSYDEDVKLVIEPCALNDGMLDLMETSCKEHGYSYMRLPSGAGHDALAVGQINPNTVMVFVPSKEGRSHCPEEYTPYEYFGKAVQVMFDLIVNLK